MASPTGFGTAGASRQRCAALPDRPLADERPNGVKEFVPNGIRTRVLALKGPRPGPLDDGDAQVRTSDDTTSCAREKNRASRRKRAETLADDCLLNRRTRYDQLDPAVSLTPRR